MKDFSNLCELVFYQAENFQNKTAFNFKEKGKLRSFSNQEFLNKVIHFACGLKEIGLQKNDILTNYSYQNPIWLIADLGAILAGAITVPIFHNISKEHLLYEIDNSKTSFVFTDNQDFYDLIKKNNLSLKIISYNFGDVDLENSDLNKKDSYFSSNRLQITFEDLINLGKKAFDQNKYDVKDFLKSVSEEDLATIIYTSGSTAKPKGVKISHRNLVSQIKDSDKFFNIKSSSIVLSFLPLAHIFERMVMMYYISRGVSIYFVDNVKNVASFAREFSPNLITSVPRVLEKVFGNIKNQVDSAGLIKNFIGKKAIERALKKDPNSKSNLIDKIFDQLIYKKFRAALGGKIDMIICGGSALSEELEIFFWNVGIKVYCGYGLTEASPVLATNCPNFHKFSTVGKNFPSVELKISDDGELLARGKNIMIGYHDREQETLETFIDGWLKTGDYAEIDNEGYVKILGRKKEIFKNSYGKFIHPVHIEQSLIKELEFLLGSLVVAESRNFTSALLFPDFEVIEKFKKKLDFKEGNKEFFASQELNEFISEKINSLNQKLDNWEQIRKFKIIEEPISIESGDITPSMKLKRKILEQKFKNEIDLIYRQSDSKN